MSQDTIDDILSLLAATIYADNLILPGEIKTFVKSASALDIIKDIDPSITETKLMLWYETHKAHIGQKMSTPFFKDWIYGLLDRLSSLEDKAALVSVMRDISQADGKVHITERVLITLTAHHWGLE